MLKLSANYAYVMCNVLHIFHASFLVPHIHHSKIRLDMLSTDQEGIRDIIIGVHNHLRSSVKPPAKNMLKMHWDDRAAR